MSEDRSSQPASDGKRSWLERLGQILQSDVKDQSQLVDSLRTAEQNSVIDADALAMIEGVLQVSDLRVRDIMIPRSQMVVVDRDAGLDQLLPIVISSAHSRFPVVGENKDEVIGILLAKDLLPMFVDGADKKLNIRDLLRPAVFIPESKRLNVLLKEFRASRNHMAIVVDEYGGVAGLVTIEDVIEQIVGEIADEHDFEDDMYIMTHDNDKFIVKAITPLDDFNEHFNTRFNEEEFDTIGGVVVNAFGHLPERGETIDIDGFHFHILRADNRRVHLLQITRAPVEPAATEEPRV
jgi:magnesium and cobalt transporter